MRHAFRSALAVLLFCGTAALAADTFDSVVKEMTATMKEMIEILRSAKDADSAKAALPKLQKSDEKAKDLAKRLIKLGTPNNKEDAKLVNEFFEKTQPGFDQDWRKEAKCIEEIKGADDLNKSHEKKK